MLVAPLTLTRRVATYLHRAFFRWWFAVYGAAIGGYDYLAGPLGWRDLTKEAYLWFAAAALMLGPAIAYVKLLTELDNLKDSLNSKKPSVSGGLLFVRQSSRFTQDTK